MILNTYTLVVLSPSPDGERSDQDRRVEANLPAMLEAVEEDLSKLLPEGYRAEIKEWNR